jgi:hypothetical protein
MLFSHLQNLIAMIGWNFLYKIRFKISRLAGAAFPGISDLLHGVDKLGKGEKMTRFKEVRKHLSDLMIVFRQSSSWLSQDIEI